MPVSAGDTAGSQKSNSLADEGNCPRSEPKPAVEFGDDLGEYSGAWMSLSIYNISCQPPRKAAILSIFHILTALEVAPASPPLPHEQWYLFVVTKFQ